MFSLPLHLWRRLLTVFYAFTSYSRSVYARSEVIFHNNIETRTSVLEKIGSEQSIWIEQPLSHERCFVDHNYHTSTRHAPIATDLDDFVRVCTLARRFVHCCPFLCRKVLIWDFWLNDALCWCELGGFCTDPHSFAPIGALRRDDDLEQGRASLRWWRECIGAAAVPVLREPCLDLRKFPKHDQKQP